MTSLRTDNNSTKTKCHDFSVKEIYPNHNLMKGSDNNNIICEVCIYEAASVKGGRAGKRGRKKGRRTERRDADRTEAKSVVRSFALPRKCLRTRPTDGMGRTVKLSRVAVAVVARMRIPSSMMQEGKPRPPHHISDARCIGHVIVNMNSQWFWKSKNWNGRPS